MNTHTATRVAALASNGLTVDEMTIGVGEGRFWFPTADLTRSIDTDVVETDNDTEIHISVWALDHNGISFESASYRFAL